MTGGGLKREQTASAESTQNTRQDRNLFITDGGVFTWDASTGIVEWDAPIKVRVGTLGEHTIPAGSQPGLASDGFAAVIQLDREAEDPTLRVVLREMDNTTMLQSDTGLVLCVRAADGRLHFRDGTVFNSGDQRRLGTTQPSDVERTDFESDGRAWPATYYALGDTVIAGSDGVISADGNTFSSATGGFLAAVAEGDYVALRAYQEHVEVISVDDDNTLTIDGSANGPSTGEPFRVIRAPVVYLTGAEQLRVEVGGLGQVAGTHYNEVGPLGTLSSWIRFANGEEPGAGESITAYNLAGAQGPAGPAQYQDLQEVYDHGSSKKVDTTADDEPVVLTGSGANPVIEVGTEGGVEDLIKLCADGTIECAGLRIPDGTGSYWVFGIGGAASLSVANDGDADSQARFHKTGGLGWGAGDELRWAEFAGSMNAGGATIIATGLAGIKGCLLLLEDTVTGFHYAVEMQLADNANRRSVVSWDPAGNLQISGDWLVTAPVGVNLQGGDYTLIVFY